MTFKDWERTRNRKTSQAWLNTKEKKTTTIEFIKNINKNEYKVILEVSGRHRILGSFKTKAQALALAKSYMRKH